MTDNKNNAFEGDDFLDKSFDKDPSDIMSMSDDELQQVAPQAEQESQENNADWENDLKEYESELAKKEDWINDIMNSVPEQDTEKQHEPVNSAAPTEMKEFKAEDFKSTNSSDTDFIISRMENDFLHNVKLAIYCPIRDQWINERASENKLLETVGNSLGKKRFTQLDAIIEKQVLDRLEESGLIDPESVRINDEHTFTIDTAEAFAIFDDVYHVHEEEINNAYSYIPEAKQPVQPEKAPDDKPEQQQETVAPEAQQAAQRELSAEEIAQSIETAITEWSKNLLIWGRSEDLFEELPEDQQKQITDLMAEKVVNGLSESGWNKLKQFALDPDDEDAMNNILSEIESIYRKNKYEINSLLPQQNAQESISQPEKQEQQQAESLNKPKDATVEYDQTEVQEQEDEIEEEPEIKPDLKQKAERQQKPALDLNEKKTGISNTFKNLFEAGKDAVKNGASFTKDKITEFIKGDPDIGQFEEAEFDKQNKTLSFGSKIKTESGDEINAKFIIKNMNKETKGIANKLAKNKKVNPSKSLKKIGDLSKRGTVKIWATTPEGKKVCIYELKKGFLNTTTIGRELGLMQGKMHPQPELGWDEDKIADFAEKLGLPVKRKEQNVDIVVDDKKQAGRDSDIDRMKAQHYEDKAKVEQEKLNKHNADAFQSPAQSDTSQSTDENISRASENQKIQNDIDEVHMAGQHLEKQEQRANSGNKNEKAGAKTDPAKKVQNEKSVIQEDVTAYKTIGVTVHPHDFKELENLGAIFNPKKEKWEVPNEPKVLADVERFLSPEESSKRRADEIAAAYRKKQHEQKQEQQRSQGKGRGR